MFNFSSILDKNRLEIISGKIISKRKTKLYNNSVKIFTGKVDNGDIGKIGRFIKDGENLTLLNISSKNNTKSKTFIV